MIFLVAVGSSSLFNSSCGNKCSEISTTAKNFSHWKSWKTDSSLDVAKIELGDPVGVLTIPSISLKLPIYDGTSDKILENGVGITEGTGDITGGNGKIL